MRRRVVFALVLFVVCASAGVQGHATTECQRWAAEYRAILAHSDAVKRANAARHRLHRYVHRKIDGLRKPKTARKSRVLADRYRRPPMSREEALRKFLLACKVDPEDASELGNLPDEPKPEFIADSKRPDDDLPLDTYTPSTLLAQNQLPSYADDGGGPGNGGYLPGFYVPGFGGAGWGGAGWGDSGRNGQTLPPTRPTANDPALTPPSVTTAEAPEPGSLLLMGTGLVGVAGVILRRLAA